MLWLIDAYNLIRSSDYWSQLELKSAEESKKRLREQMQEFCQYTRDQVSLIYDAYGRVAHDLDINKDGRLEEVLTCRGMSADEEIIQRLENSASNDVFLVSSDKEIQRVARSHRVAYVYSREFIYWFSRIIERAQGEWDEDDYVDEENSHKKSQQVPKERRRALSRLKRFALN